MALAFLQLAFASFAILKAAKIDLLAWLGQLFYQILIFVATFARLFFVGNLLNLGLLLLLIVVGHALDALLDVLDAFEREIVLCQILQLLYVVLHIEHAHVEAAVHELEVDFLEEL